KSATMNICKTEILIIGGGIAGMMAADVLSREKEVTILTKDSWKHSNSMKAQGGIAAAITKEDDWTHHFLDTLTAGDFHNNKEATRLLVQKGIQHVKKLQSFGVPFDRDTEGNLALGR